MIGIEPPTRSMTLVRYGKDIEKAVLARGLRSTSKTGCWCTANRPSFRMRPIAGRGYCPSRPLRKASMITLQASPCAGGAKVLLDGASVTVDPGREVGWLAQRRRKIDVVRAVRRAAAREDGGDFYRPASSAAGAGCAGMPKPR